MSSRTSRTAIAGLLFSPLLAAPAWGAQTTLHCGDVITANTRLAADLTGCPVHGLVIGADGITLDLNGHTIAGDGVAATGNPDVGVLSGGHDRVIVRNGAVTGFDLGVFSFDAADGAQVLDLRVRASSGSGILVRSSTHTRVEGNDAAGSGFSGSPCCSATTTSSRATSRPETARAGSATSAAPRTGFSTTGHPTMRSAASCSTAPAGPQSPRTWSRTIPTTSSSSATTTVWCATS